MLLDSKYTHWAILLTLFYTSISLYLHRGGGVLKLYGFFTVNCFRYAENNESVTQLRYWFDENYLCFSKLPLKKWWNNTKFIMIFPRDGHKQTKWRMNHSEHTFREKTREKSAKIWKLSKISHVSLGHWYILKSLEMRQITLKMILSGWIMVLFHIKEYDSLI